MPLFVAIDQLRSLRNPMLIQFSFKYDVVLPSPRYPEPSGNGDRDRRQEIRKPCHKSLVALWSLTRALWSKLRKHSSIALRIENSFVHLEIRMLACVRRQEIGELLE